MEVPWLQCRVRALHGICNNDVEKISEIQAVKYFIPRVGKGPMTRDMFVRDYKHG